MDLVWMHMKNISSILFISARRQLLSNSLSREHGEGITMGPQVARVPFVAVQSALNIATSKQRMRNTRPGRVQASNLCDASTYNVASACLFISKTTVECHTHSAVRSLQWGDSNFQQKDTRNFFGGWSLAGVTHSLRGDTQVLLPLASFTERNLNNTQRWESMSRAQTSRRDLVRPRWLPKLCTT